MKTLSSELPKRLKHPLKCAREAVLILSGAEIFCFFPVLSFQTRFKAVLTPSQSIAIHSTAQTSPNPAKQPRKELRSYFCFPTVWLFGGWGDVFEEAEKLPVFTPTSETVPEDAESRSFFPQSTQPSRNRRRGF